MALVDTPIQQAIRKSAFINNGRFRINKARKMFTGITLERQYQRRIRKLIISNMKEVLNVVLIPRINEILESADLLRPKIDRMDQDHANIIVATMNDVRIGFSQSVTEREKMILAQRTAELTSNFQREQLAQVLLSQVGVDIFFSEPWLESELAAFVENNVGLINNISDKAFEDIERIVFQGARQGITQEEMVEQIRARVSVATSRANLIARDQINKFFGQLNELRQKSVGVEKYIWRTVDDNRVRASHNDKDDRTFSWNKPPADTGHPGNDFQCRCYGEPVLSELLLELRAA